MPELQKKNSWLVLSSAEDHLLVTLQGAWRISELRQILNSTATLQLPSSKPIKIDCSGLGGIDTAGAYILFDLLDRSGIKPGRVAFINVDEKQQSLIQLVGENYGPDSCNIKGQLLGPLQKLGQATTVVYGHVRALLTLIGQTTQEVLRLSINPTRIRVKELFAQLEMVFLDAIPIVMLVTFLIGIVIAYLSAIQIEKYGANIFIVDATSLAMCRELSPIIVAIIVAGRSGSAFTAHIGTMKLNEEIDALLTLGLSPLQVLVIPRFLSLIIALPLLVFVGDVVGIFGGLIVADFRLGITGPTFIERLDSVLPVRHLVVGLVKAPVFAAFIAVIGCRMGFAVENNARSVGINTTSTVVQSIVAVILLNAAFAIIFVELGV